MRWETNIKVFLTTSIMKKGMIIEGIVIGLAILICGILLMDKKGHELYSTIYYFGFGSRSVKIYEDGDVYDDLEIEDPNHKTNYKFLKRLSKEQLDSLKNKLKDTSDNNELREYVIELVYSVKKFDDSGRY